MSETLIIADGDKRSKYATLLPQIEALLSAESDAIACMANVSAALHDTFRFWWVGFYRVVGNQLVLGPFQGPLACTRIPRGKGVCGTAWEQGSTIVVPDVDAFPGHIACSSASRSEIVVPIFSGNEVVAVIDIDSELPDHFDQTDADALQSIASMLSVKFT